MGTGGLSRARLARASVFEPGGGGLVPTVDSFHSFGRMMLNKGQFGREHILSRLSVDLMTIDHRIAEQKAASDFFPGFWDRHGWGFGVAAALRRYGWGWDGGYGTSWYAEPREGMDSILLTRRLTDSPVPQPVYLDFWTLAYQAIDD